MEGISLSVISFTKSGNTLAQILREQMDSELNRCEIRCYSMKEECSESEYVKNLKEWTSRQFEQHNAILFIGACGIAVRAIAPYVRDKLSDSPVLVMDEKGQFVIPILSGHVGGANEIAELVGVVTGAVPVITTATDVQGSLAIDVFAKNHDLSIGNRTGIAKVSSKVLEKRKLSFSIAPELQGQVDVRISRHPEESNTLLNLIPKEYLIGIGCRKGKAPEELLEFIEEQLAFAKIDWKQVNAIATIDIKKEEAAIVQLSRNKHIPLRIYDATILSKVEGEYTASEFVKSQVGVDNVCERSAMAACEGQGELVVSKQAKNGMTIAIAKKDWRLSIYEE